MSKLMILQCARTQKKTIRIGYLLTKLKWYPRCISHLLWKDHPNRRHLPVPRGTTGAHLASQQHNNWFLSTPVDSLTMKKSKENLNVTLRKALSLFSRLSIGDIVMNTNEINHNNDPQPISFFFLTANYHLAQTLLSSHCHNCLEPGRLCLLIFILFWAPQLFTSCLICERGLAQPCRALRGPFWSSHHSTSGHAFVLLSSCYLHPNLHFSNRLGPKFCTMSSGSHSISKKGLSSFNPKLMQAISSCPCL